MHKTATITAAIVGASALLADLIFSVNTFFRHKKMLTKLCDENAELLATNTHLQAVNAGLHRKKADLERQLDTCLNRGIAQNDKIIKLEKEHSDTKDKLKSAHDHISVLRAEIVKLNRQLNQRKRRG